MKKTYVTYQQPGVFLAETTTKEIGERDVEKALAMMPKDCYAFYFWDREETVVDGETLRGQRKNESPRYYPGGKKLHWTDIEDTPRNACLIANIKGNGKDGYGVKTRMGNHQWLQEGDVILPEGK